MRKFDSVISGVNKEVSRVMVNKVSCNNPKCATTTEKYVSQILHLVDLDKKEYRCEYCDHIITVK